MKRRLTGEIRVAGYIPVMGCECLYVLPFGMACKWEEKKGYDAIALLWQGKLYFRKLYFRNSQFCFKFFNHIIYFNEIERIDGTPIYIQV